MDRLWRLKADRDFQHPLSQTPHTAQFLCKEACTAAGPSHAAASPCRSRGRKGGGGWRTVKAQGFRALVVRVFKASGLGGFIPSVLIKAPKTLPPRHPQTTHYPFSIWGFGTAREGSAHALHPKLPSCKSHCFLMKVSKHEGHVWVSGFLEGFGGRGHIAHREA